MNKAIIKKEVEINTTSAKVWDVFTVPDITQRMGGEYVSEWKQGSSFGWKGKNGQMMTKGIIQEIIPGKLLRHGLLDMNDERLLSVITYDLIDNNNSTLLRATEELNYEMTDDQYKEASDGWDAALRFLKTTAEQV